MLVSCSAATRHGKESLLGDYVWAGTTISVTLKGDRALVLSWPGQPSVELVPYQGVEFRGSRVSGYGAEFGRDESGRIVEMVVTQPDRVFTAKKRSAS